MKNIFKLHLFLLMFLMLSGDLFAQLKLDEGFEGATFPPSGWSSVSVVAGSGAWFRTTSTPKFGVADATSNYTTAGANNYLISKRFVPSAGDSLVFWYAQVFTAVYEDTLKVRISTTDSLVPSLSTILLTLKDGEYPLPVGTYARVAISLNAYAGQTCWLGWQHVDLDGDDIRLDGIAVGTPVANQITLADASSLDSANTDDTYAPKATVTNSGSANQYNFNVTYSINGPTLTSHMVSYLSTKSIDTLLAGQSKTITFDSTFTPVDSGSYDASITSSVGDLIPSIFKFRILFKDWGVTAGGNCCYWWANSQAKYPFTNIPIPTRPTYSWIDPAFAGGGVAAKVVLANNGVNNFPAAPVFSGSLDDGNWAGTLSQFGKAIKLCGVCYDSFFVGTNGLLGLNGSRTNMNAFTPGLAAGPFPAILPLWMDFNFSAPTAGVAGSNITYVITPGAKELIVTWTKAKRFNSNDTDYVSFQACIELVNINCIGDNSNIRFSYNKSKTGAAFLALGVGASIGAGAGNGNTVTNQLVGLRPVGGAASSVYYRKRNNPANLANKTGPTFGGANNNSTSLAVEFAQCFNPLNKCNSKILCARFYLEGWKLSGTPLLDTVNLSMRTAISPYPILETVPGVFDATGRVYVPMSYLEAGESYWITVQHRNALKTWSNLTVSPNALPGDTLAYDFRSALSQAYGSNQVLVNTDVCFYSGDVNQDGVIDVSDAGLVDNDAFNFVAGYVNTDVNGDGIVDVSDAAIVDNNSYNFVAEAAPPGPVANEDSYLNLPVENLNQLSGANDKAYEIEKLNYIRNEELRLTSPEKMK